MGVFDHTAGDPQTGPPGHKTIDVGDAAVGIGTVPFRTKRALICVLPGATSPSNPNQAVRWKGNGEDPTGSEGLALSTYDYIYLDTLEQIKNFRAIRGSDQDVVLEVQFYIGE